MAPASERPKTREGVITTVNIIIQGLEFAKDACGFPPAQVACGAVSTLLSMMIVRFYRSVTVGLWFTFI